MAIGKPPLDVRLPAARFEQLEWKERAHDDYLAAMKEVRQKAAAVMVSLPEDQAFIAGYRGALRDLSLAILREAGKRVAPDGG